MAKDGFELLQCHLPQSPVLSLWPLLQGPAPRSVLPPEDKGGRGEKATRGD